jgi:hypothetical protein
MSKFYTLREKKTKKFPQRYSGLLNGSNHEITYAKGIEEMYLQKNLSEIGVYITKLSELGIDLSEFEIVSICEEELGNLNFG